jgi:hypothetical protein
MYTDNPTNTMTQFTKPTYTDLATFSELKTSTDMNTNIHTILPTHSITDLQITTTTSTLSTTTISPYLTMDFCPGAAKTIDCSASGELVYFVDAFYGVSDQVPAVCEYK